MAIFCRCLCRRLTLIGARIPLPLKLWHLPFSYFDRDKSRSEVPASYCHSQFRSQPLLIRGSMQRETFLGDRIIARSTGIQNIQTGRERGEKIQAQSPKTIFVEVIDARPLFCGLITTLLPSRRPFEHSPSLQ